MHQFGDAQKQSTIIVVVVAHSYEAQIHTPGTQYISIIYYPRATCDAGTLVNFHGMLTISQGILHRVHEIAFLYGAKLFPLWLPGLGFSYTSDCMLNKCEAQ